MQIQKTDYGFHVRLDKNVTIRSALCAATRLWDTDGVKVGGWRMETNVNELVFFDPALNEDYLDHEPLP